MLCRIEDVSSLCLGDMNYKELTRICREKKLGRTFTYITRPEVLEEFLIYAQGRGEMLRDAFIHFIENNKVDFVPLIARVFDIRSFVRNDIYGKHGYFFLFSGISVEMMVALLNNGYDPNADLDQESPFDSSETRNLKKCKRDIFSYVCVSKPRYIRLFLENGADINKVRGSVPLGFFIIMSGREDHIRAIVEHGFDLRSRDEQGCSVYSVNLSKPCYKTFELLRQLGAPVERDIIEKIPSTLSESARANLTSYFTALLQEQE